MKIILILLLLTTFSGCRLFDRRSELPDSHELVREQMVFHTNFFLPTQHRIVDDLVALRYDVARTLELPLSDEPIQIFLFENERKFRRYIDQNYPGFPNRRAFFIKTDTQLSVIAFWGDRIAEDIRHEATHGYVHSSVPNVPLWLDEGIAEYFEVSRSEQGINTTHVRILASALRNEDWKPDLDRLESLAQDVDLTSLQYAESWLWVHFLLNCDAHTRSLICQTLRQLRETGQAPPIAAGIQEWLPDANHLLIMHLKKLADEA